MNIFAYELKDVLETGHKTSLNHLHSLAIKAHIEPGRIQRLIRSLEDNHSVTLNPHQIDELAKLIPLTPSEIKRLRIALLAECVHAFLTERITLDEAEQVGRNLQQLLLNSNDPQTRAPLGKILDLTRSTSDVEGETVLTSSANVYRLNDAWHILDRAQVWLTIAEETPNATFRQGYIKQIEFLLEEGERLLQVVRMSLHENEEQLSEEVKHLADAIRQAQQDIEEIQ